MDMLKLLVEKVCMIMLLSGDRAARSWREVRMYLRNDSLFQRPSIRIVELLSPLTAAVVAPPIQKEWPAQWDESSPACCRASFTCNTNMFLYRGVTSLFLNKGSSSIPRTSKYLSIVMTGHKELYVRPTYIGCCMLSTVMSSGVKWIAGVKSCPFWYRNFTRPHKCKEPNAAGCPDKELVITACSTGNQGVPNHFQDWWCNW